MNKLTVKHKPDGVHYYKGYKLAAFIGYCKGRFYCTLYPEQSTQKVWCETIADADKYVRAHI